MKCRRSIQFLMAVVLVGWSGRTEAQVDSTQVDSTQSFYVPQRGTVATPIEGNAAISFFRACPNNDGGTSLPNNARIKVVLRDNLSNPIAGVPAGDICVLFNGGTLVQGFPGPGADEIIANSLWNTMPLCPDVTCIEADAPTDATGTTYITFTGSTPGSPGVGTRNALRKWGHYDTIPVFAQGTPLQGRLTTASPNGTYTLQIKNYDLVGGLTAVLNQGERVTSSDFNAFVIMCTGGACPGGSLCHWCDFDSNGSIGSPDFNQLAGHLGHDCDTPLSP